MKDEATGVQLIREFVLDESSSRPIFTQTIKNVSDRRAFWCHWSRTFAQGGGVCVVPHKFPEPGHDVDLKALSQTVSGLFGAELPLRERRPASLNRRHQASAFDVTTKKKEDQVKVQIEGEKAVFGITSPSGIGSVTIKPRTEQWPDTVVIRLHLRGLESLRISTGKTTIAAAVSSHTDHETRLFLLEDGKEKAVERSSPLWMDIKLLDAKGSPAKKIPLEGGYFEVMVPKAILQGRPESLAVQWIDFYRG